MTSGGELHPLVQAAARGELPSWARAGESRRRHMERVAGLMGEWAATLELPPVDQDRWLALAWLHDALREAPPQEIEAWVPEPIRPLPGKVYHGPAAAARLEEDGVTDAPLLEAVRYHTLGSPKLDFMGRALYAADFLDPGRSLMEEWRGSLRARMPAEADAVVLEIVEARVEYILGREGRVFTETARFLTAMREKVGG